MRDPKTSMGGDDSAFPLTRWSQIRKAREGDDRREALDALVRAYWRPLYLYLRAAGRSNEDAKDAVQGFFETWLERDALAAFDPAKGRFRTFLLTCLKNYEADEHDKNEAKKRGGGRGRVSLDASGAEEWLRLPSREETPEQAFDRAWAVAKLNRAIEAVRAGYLAQGQGPALAAIDAYLKSDSLARPSYARLMERSGLSENQVRHLLHQFRQRLRENVMEEILSETNDPAAAEEELRLIFASLTG